MLDHCKLRVTGTAFGHACHADLFVRPGRGPDVRRVDLVHVGGACSETEYERRESTRPDGLARAFEAALEDRPELGARLLVIPAPPGDPTRLDSRLTDFRALVTDGFAPAAGFRPEEAWQLSGTSVGAHLVTALLAGAPPGRRLVTYGGVGMVEAAREVNARPEAVRCFVNRQDPAREHAARLEEWARGRGVPCDVREGPGGHGFADYLGNGAVAEGLRSLLGT